MPEKNIFICRECGNDFAVSSEALAKYPGWTPKQCWSCKQGKTKSAETAGAVKEGENVVDKVRPSASHREENLTTAQVLAKYTTGPDTGIFTDGGCEPNPGPGGWGAVYVDGGKIIAEDCGHEEMTTNNRMELSGIRAAIGMVPVGTPVVIHSDSQLCVNTFNTWAKEWAKRGWTRKSKEEIKNLDLIVEIYDMLQARPEITLQWIKAHNGSRWNEYADSLATAWRRDER